MTLMKPVSLTARPIGLKTPPKVGGTPKLAAVHAMKITPVSNGFHVQHAFHGSGSIMGPVHPGVSSPRSFVFPSSDKLLRHVQKTATKMRAQSNALRLGHSLG